MDTQSANKDGSLGGKLLKWISMVVVILTALVGTGAWWSYKGNAIEQSKYDLAKVAEKRELRTKIAEDVFKLIELHKKSDDLHLETMTLWESGVTQELNKIKNWRDKLITSINQTHRIHDLEIPTIEKNIIAREASLAALEGRKPQTFPFPKQLPRPKNLRVISGTKHLVKQ